MNVSDAVIRIYPIVILCLFLFSLFAALAKYFFRAFGCIPKTRVFYVFISKPRRLRTKAARLATSDVFAALLALALSRAAIFLIGYIGRAISGGTEYFIRNQLAVWSQWDAPHYLGIAKNGYQVTGDARLHIVFYPLYPYLVRALTFGVISAETSAFIVSNACLLLSGLVLLLLVKQTYGEKYARGSLFFFMFSPAAVFFSIPYTESLFMLLTLLSVYLARNRRFGASILFASLASFTRLPGVITAVCVFFEMIRSRRPEKLPAKNAKEKRRKVFSAIFPCFLSCLLILSGFAAYLIVNQAVTGNAFTFLKYQSEHWGQRAGNLLHTAKYSIQYLFYPFVEWYRMGVYLPQCVTMLLLMLLLAFSVRRAHPGDLAYAVVYAYVTLSPTMLISGARYISALYCVYPFAALLTGRNRLLKVLVPLLAAALFVYGAWMYVVEGTYL